MTYPIVNAVFHLFSFFVGRPESYESKRNHYRHRNVIVVGEKRTISSAQSEDDKNTLTQQIMAVHCYPINFRAHGLMCSL